MEFPKDIKYYHVRADLIDNVVEVSVAFELVNINGGHLIQGVYHIQRAGEIDPTLLERFETVLKDEYPSLIKVEVKDFLRFYMRDPHQRKELSTLCKTQR